MKIKILKIDFRKGERRECGTCPVARGCLRAAKPLGYTSVVVLARSARFFWRAPMGTMGGRSVRRALPPSARGAIRRFDHDRNISKSDFQPFEFEIEDLPRMQ